ncbi:hemolysin family protein, partial [Actinotignum sanguinis]
RVLRKATWWLSPLTWLLSLLIREREFSPEEAEQRQEDQLAVMVERVAESEALDDAERDILQSLFDMGNTLVREVMVPRTDMIAVEADETLDRAISLFTRSGFSRVPVYRESIDDVIGVLYLKDVIRRVHRRHQHDELRVADLVREPVFVPETKIIDTLMREMQADQVHIALVVDEYGGIAGLVTIEDLVEELVGEISDEHDRALPAVEELEAGSFRIPARMPIDDLGDLFGIELEDDDVDTAGGFFAKSIGRVPIRGAETTVAGIHMVADRFEGRRRRLSTIIVAREETDDEGED